jgi:hypothetical protein
MSNVALLHNIASDAATILQRRLNDSRRSAPFEAMADRTDTALCNDLRSELVRAIRSLSAKHARVADEIRELLSRLDRLKP